MSGMMRATHALLSGGRLHFQHGPIDLVIGAEGDARSVRAAHVAAWLRFEGLLDALVAELPLLKRPVSGACPLAGEVARSMWQACKPFDDQFITPMAAVAGSVAQDIIKAYARPGVERAWVNNGGDIALHMVQGQAVRVGLWADLARFHPALLQHGLDLDGNLSIDANSSVRGVATSGWRGRSFSRGVADSVTVLARTASQADAAATVIANAVNVDIPQIRRAPAASIRHDSDLGDIPVTVDVPVLPRAAVREALDRGMECASDLLERGLIEACFLACQGQSRQVGALAWQKKLPQHGALAWDVLPERAEAVLEGTTRSDE